MSVFEIKQEDTLLITGIRRAGSITGDPVDLSTSTVSSQIRLFSEVKPLTVTITDAANGTFTLAATSAETKTWLPGRWRCDIQFTDSGVVASSDTFTITVLEDVTR